MAATHSQIPSLARLAIGSRAGRLARAALRPAVTFGMTAVCALGLLQLIAWPDQDPVSRTVSAMFFAPGGWLLMPLAGVLALAGLGALAIAALAERRALLATTFAIWGVALAAATVFPTDPPGMTVISASGQIHRWAAAVMFIVAPLAGWIATRRGSGRSVPGGGLPGGRGLRGRCGSQGVRSLSLACAAAAVANLVIQLPKVATGVVADALRPALHYGGLTERLLIGLMFAQLIVMVVRERRRWLPGAGRVARRDVVTVHALRDRLHPVAVGRAA